MGNRSSSKKQKPENGDKCNGTKGTKPEKPKKPKKPGKDTPSPPLTPPAPAVKIVKAIYDYDPVQNDDLGFQKGDKLQILDDESNKDWWFARNVTNRQEGYIPSNYVVDDNDAPEAQDWWFSIDRREANKQLMMPTNPSGTFLIRNSTDHTSYALSVRVLDQVSEEFVIKHYRIKKQAADGRVCITQKLLFNTLVELVNHYRDNVNGLCCQLSNPCPKELQSVPFKSLEVDRNEVKLQNKLGAGQFGEVFKAKLRKTFVAVKTLKEGSMTVEAFLDEAKIMHKLRHRKLVQLMGVCTEMEPVYIITEFMEKGALLEFLRNDGRSTTIVNLIDMAAQIADGMAYLESQDPPFVHRDLRAANILVGDNNNVKVADFGLARILEEDEYIACEKSKFPVKWTAPEAAYDHKFSVKSDVWSYGILLYEIITYGRAPYPGMDGSTVLQSVSTGYRMPRPTGRNFECPEKMYEKMLNCWDFNPDKRPTFSHLLTFFDDYATETEEHYHPPEGD